MPVNSADINYNKTFKIIFGVPESRPDPMQQETVVDVESQYTRWQSANTIPYDVVSYTNFEKGKFTRGVKFDLRTSRKASSQANTEELSLITIYNMPEKDIKRLTREGSLIQVLAGYNGKMDLIYSGDIMGVYPRRNGQDMGYEIRCKDGGYTEKNQRVSIDYEENIPILDVIKDLLLRMGGVSLVAAVAEELKDVKVTGGISVQGKLLNVVNRLCKQYGLQFIRYNGKILLRPTQLTAGSSDHTELVKNNYRLKDYHIKDLQPVLDNKGKLSEQKNTRRGVKVSTFLIPVSLDQFFTIPETQKEYKGTYKATEIYVNLSFPNGAWDVSIKGEPT